MREALDFARINQSALAAFPAVLARILPGGKAIGRELVALNPRRADRNVGSFKVRPLTDRPESGRPIDSGLRPVTRMTLGQLSRSQQGLYRGA